MELKLVRSVFNQKSTLGKLFLNGKFFAYTCEDKTRNLNGDCSRKVQNQTAIDPGRYRVVLSYSNRFKKYLPELLDVPCFKYIRIHGGNTAEDSEGCILVGAESDNQNRIWNCASKVNGLVAQMKDVEKKEKIYITIEKG